jgi:hypothetical protein
MLILKHFAIKLYKNFYFPLLSFYTFPPDYRNAAASHWYEDF